MDQQRQKAMDALVAFIGGSDCMDESWWWLRSPGNNQNNAAEVNSDGDINTNGNNVNNENGVRPALPDSPEAAPKLDSPYTGERSQIPS